MGQPGEKGRAACGALGIACIMSLHGSAPAGIVMGAGTAGPPRLAEIRVDQQGTDTDEYFEISGEPLGSLAGLWFLAIGDSGTDPGGIVEMAIDLSSWSLGQNGRFVCHESTFGATILDGRALTVDPAASHAALGTGDTLNFENSDTVTYLLVRSFTGTLGMDLDAGNDGKLDASPWGEILDSVAFVRSGSSDPAYSSTRLGPVQLTATGGMPPHGWYDGTSWQAGEYASWSLDTPGGAPALPAPGAVATLAVAAGFARRSRAR